PSGGLALAPATSTVFLHMPALTSIGRAWRRLDALDPLLVDSALAVTLAAAAAVVYVQEGGWQPGRLPPGVASVLPLVGRRRYAFLCRVARGGLGAAFEAPPTVPAFFAYLIGYSWVGAHSPRRLLPLVIMLAEQLFLIVLTPVAHPPLPPRFEN